MSSSLPILDDLHGYKRRFPHETAVTDTIHWIEKYGASAFEKENLEGHVTASIWITNPDRTKLLLMFHRIYHMWCQFGGHCDGETDTLAVAKREFQEESGISLSPHIHGILSVETWDIAPRTGRSGVFRPAHTHFDILYLGSVPDDTPFARQEDEVDAIAWIDLQDIERYVTQEQSLRMIEKIRDFV